MERIKIRGDFLAAARGIRRHGRYFTLQVRDRGDRNAPRFGFTVTRKTASRAVDRNRIKRRLREAVRHHAMPEARAGMDYVLVARRGSLDAPFAELCCAVTDGLRDLHRELDRGVPAKVGQGNGGRPSAAAQEGDDG